MIRIFVTDDHEIVRQGICALLEKERHIEIVGTAGSGRETLEKISSAKPDLLILDIMLPDMSGLEVIGDAKAVLPGLRIIVLSMYDNKVYLFEALRRGADGYVIKGSSGGDLLNAIASVTSGHRYMTAQLAEHIMDDLAVRRAKSAETFVLRLTPREEQVLCMTVDGLSSSDIADQLAISSRTVEAHRNNLMKKLGLHNKTELIRYAMERGLAGKP